MDTTTTTRSRLPRLGSFALVAAALLAVHPPGGGTPVRAAPPGALVLDGASTATVEVVLDRPLDLLPLRDPGVSLGTSVGDYVGYLVEDAEGTTVAGGLQVHG